MMKAYTKGFTLGLLLVLVSVFYIRLSEQSVSAETSNDEYTIHAWIATLPADDLTFLASVRHHDVWLAAYEDIEGVFWVFRSFRNENISTGSTGMGAAFDITGMEIRSIDNDRVNAMLTEMDEHFARAPRFGRSRTSAIDLVMPNHDYSNGLELTFGWRTGDGEDTTFGRARMIVFPFHEKSR